jgi:DNA-binding transcriptional ArsR family regulator
VVDLAELWCEDAVLCRRRSMAKARRARCIPSRSLQEVAVVLKVLAHPHRLRIVEILLSESVSVRKLASMLKLSPPVVSQHLGQMRSHGIVRPRREGRHVYYEVMSRSAANLIQCIRNHGPR